MRILKWPSIVQLAADHAAAIKAAATAGDAWRAPLISRYCDLLLTLMARPETQAMPATFDNLCDRFERALAAALTTSEPGQRGVDA